MIEKKEYNIKEIREKLKLTQEAMARELNISLTTLRNWEYNYFKPSRLASEKIEELLKKSLYP